MAIESGDGGADEKRGRGRPRLELDRDAIADAVASLFAEGGYQAVSLADTAEKLSVSRATLYRSVPTKDGLLGILFERTMKELTAEADSVVSGTDDPAEQLRSLIRSQIDAAIRMRSYIAIFFGGGDLPSDVVAGWHTWRRQYERQWTDVVEANLQQGTLGGEDAVVATRLIQGMIIWVSRWYRPRERLSADHIAESVIALLRL